MSTRLTYSISSILLLGLAGSAAGVEGLLGEYYKRDTANPWQNLLMKRLDTTVNFYWGSASPDPSVPADGFMIRWTGEVEAPTTATYTFYTQTDDGVRLWVNDRSIVDNWTNHGSTLDRGSIKLSGGRRYTIVLEYYEDGGDAVCQLSWSTPTMTREIIKSQYLWVGGSRPDSRFPDPIDGALIRNTRVTLEWAPGDYAASHSIYIGENRDDVGAGSGETFRVNQTDTSYSAGFSGFPYPDGLVTGTTYYWRVEEVNDLHPDSPWKGDVWSFTIAPRTAFGPDPADGGERVRTGGRLTWQLGYNSKLHYVYFGDDYDAVSNATATPPTPLTFYSPVNMEPAKVYYWRVDEFDGFNTYRGDVWSFTTAGAVGTPNPRYGAVNVSHTQPLSWVAGDLAASHQVYFGTDEAAVRNATTSSPEYKGPKDLGSESYDPGLLEWDTDYYWRIDEVNDANSSSPWKGNVWSFTTADFFVVDDFESYNDIDPPHPLGRTIFAEWADGYQKDENGALIGNNLPPYAEQDVVHGGLQSMPYLYEADGKYAEATHTIAYPRDWTQKGVVTLSVWFKGDYVNDAVPMYVAIASANGVSVAVNHDDSEATRINVWTEWTIPLQVFADQGVNLMDVETISIGFGNKNNPQPGGSGSMFFDDIRLEKPPVSTNDS